MSSLSSKGSISTKAIKLIIDKLKNDRVRDSTKTNYYCVWKLFNEFFIKLDVKPHSWEERLTLFVEYLIESKYKSTTIKSYISAIKAVLRNDGVELQEDKYLLALLTRACKLKNDTVRTRLPIQKGMLHIILRSTKNYYLNLGQPYLAHMYVAVFSTAYYGLFRVGEHMTNIRISSCCGKLR